ncbi:DUF2062 domain-containing protein [bacterium]|nr:DUF2062 domain-containing protein [candidate division CSSED10-310 bacterium]
MGKLKNLRSRLPALPACEEKGVFRRMKYYVNRVLHLDGDPDWIAFSFATGVFISMTPFYGTHTITIIILIPLLKLNAVAAILGSMINLPWVALVIYPFAFALGETLFGNWDKLHDSFPRSLSEMLHLFTTWQGFMDVLLPFIVGSMVVSALAGVIAYKLVGSAIRQVRRSRRSDPVEVGQSSDWDQARDDGVAGTEESVDRSCVCR